MKITNQNSLEHAFATGINLFVGAGFSILAHDKCGRKIPLGNALRDELASKFGKSNAFSLAQISTILEASCKDDFQKYLTERFTIGEYDARYENLNKLLIKSGLLLI